MKEKLCQISEQNLRYNLDIRKKKVAFDILNDISKNSTLVQLMDSLVNVNNDISIVGYWVFYSNHEKALNMKRESLDLIFPPSVGEEKVVIF